jgi:hypothetical protein
MKLTDLPIKLQQLVKEEYFKQQGEHISDYDISSYTVVNAIFWSETSQGLSFWDNVNKGIFPEHCINYELTYKEEL